MIISETDRLIIQEFTTGDTAFIVALVNTPSWIRYIGERNIKSTEDAMNYLVNGPLKSYREHGFGLYLVKLKNENIPVGMCGLIKRETLDDVDIGFAFLPEHEKKGYAFESAMAVMEKAQSLGLQRIVAITMNENERSIRLLEKIKMKFEKMIVMPGGNEELMLFSINFDK